MHELGLIIDVVERVEAIALEQRADVKSVVLQVGETFSVVPQLIRSVYRGAVKGTALEGSTLELEIIPAEVECQDCGTRFNPFETDAACPKCGSDDYSVLYGKEFIIKELKVADTGE